MRITEYEAGRRLVLEESSYKPMPDPGCVTGCLFSVAAPLVVAVVVPWWQEMDIPGSFLTWWGIIFAVTAVFILLGGWTQEIRRLELDADGRRVRWDTVSYLGKFRSRTLPFGRIRAMSLERSADSESNLLTLKLAKGGSGEKDLAFPVEFLKTAAEFRDLGHRMAMILGIRKFGGSPEELKHKIQYGPNQAMDVPVSLESIPEYGVERMIDPSKDARWPTKDLDQEHLDGFQISEYREGGRLVVRRASEMGCTVATLVISGLTLAGLAWMVTQPEEPPVYYTIGVAILTTACVGFLYQFAVTKADPGIDFDATKQTIVFPGRRDRPPIDFRIVRSVIASFAAHATIYLDSEKGYIPVPCRVNSVDAKGKEWVTSYARAIADVLQVPLSVYEASTSENCGR